MTATLTRKSPKSSSIEQLAKNKARGGSKADVIKPPPSLAEELNKSIRDRAGRLEKLQGVEISEEDRNFLGFVYSGMNLNAGDVVRLQCLLERHGKALNGKHNGNGHPALTGNSTPAGIMANDASATGETTESVRGNGKAKSETKLPKPETTAAVGEMGPVMKVHVVDLVRHPANRKVSGEAIDERAESMRDMGQLEPIIVRRTDRGYQILSGETRWLAARKLGWTEIDARVRGCTEPEALELVAEANSQRKDLNPIERAQLIEQLCKPIGGVGTPADERGAGLTKDAAAKRVGLKDGSSASNLVRLLKLPKVWQDRVAGGELPESFARLMVPVIALGPVLDALEKDWKSKDKPRNHWEENAFDTREKLEASIQDFIDDECRPLDQLQENAGGKRRQNAIDLADPELRKKLGVVELELPKRNGKNGQLETVAIATNVKAFDKLLEEQSNRTAKTQAEKAGRDGPAPKREPTAAERKANAAKQAKYLEHRREVWRHEWLKSLVADQLEDQDWQATKLLCWVLTHIHSWTVQRGGHWPNKINDALQQHGGRGNDWRAVNSLPLAAFSVPVMREHRKSQRSFELDSVLRDFLRLVVLEEDRDSHHPVIPYEVLDGIAADYSIDLAKEWERLQVDPKGRERLERFFLQHQTEQLRDLSKELGKHMPDTATRAGMTKLLMMHVGPTVSTRFKLPKCIKPLSVPGKRKAKK